jgi:orotate phosphoribosyltransferase
MKDIDILTNRATEMKANGMLDGQIADELNISRETIVWLLTRASKREGVRAPKDLSIDWGSIGESSYRMRCVSDAMVDLVLDNIGSFEGADVVVGIAVSGIPLASIVANELDARLAIFHPNKQLFGTENSDAVGIFSQSFADVKGANCVIVDDVITTGHTLVETTRQLTNAGAKPTAITVLVDKLGQDTIEGVPVHPLLRILWVV